LGSRLTRTEEAIFSRLSGDLQLATLTKKVIFQRRGDDVRGSQMERGAKRSKLLVIALSRFFYFFARASTHFPVPAFTCRIECRAAIAHSRLMQTLDSILFALF
jgi:hypothetical protein